MDWSWLERLISGTPIPLIGIGLIALMLAAALGAAWLRKREPPARETDEKDGEGQEGYVVSSVLGLLALLLGFTFSLAVDRYEARRALVLDEANALGTAYLRAQLLPEPHRARMSTILIDYTNNRVQLAQLPRGQNSALLARNDALLTDMWTETVAVWPQIRGLDFSSAYIDSLNHVIDLDTSRKAARLARVPAEVFGMLFLYAIAAAAVLGYVLKGGRTRGSAFALLVLLSLALLLIVDIDQPVGGGISEAQLPMELLQKSLKTWQPSVFDRLSTPPAVPAPSTP